MKKIQITAVPPGKLPLDIRAQFVGVSMPYDPDIQKFAELGAMEHDSTEKGYVVRINHVIEALREYRQTRAADFLCHAGAGEKFIWFPADICKLIES